MMSDWKEYRLGDITEWSSGGTPSKKNDVFWDGDIPWISASSMSGNRYSDSSLKITEAGLKAGSRLAVKDAILLLVRGSTLHKRILVGITTRDVAFNQDVKSIIPKEEFLDSWYLLFWFMSIEKDLLNMVENTGIGAGKLDTKLLQNLIIKIPPKEERDRIKACAKAIDDKLILNSQTNQTLEQIAQAIFKSWFVDFEPVKAKAQVRASVAAGWLPGSEQKTPLPKDFDVEAAVERAAMCAISGKSLAELDAQVCTNAVGKGSAGAVEKLSIETQQQLKTTAALFPDTLVESELGEIPDGWSIVDLKKLSIKISKGTTPRKADIANAENEEIIPFLKVRDISDNGEITRVGLDKIPESVHFGILKRSILETNDLLFSIAGTIGRVAVVEKDLNNSNCNQAVAFVRLKKPEKYLELCRLNLVSNRVQDDVTSKVVQGVQANFSLTGLGEVEIVLPTHNLLDVFNKNIISIAVKQRLLLKENRKLSEIRDVLLPKLLSGELSLKTTQMELEKVI